MTAIYTIPDRVLERWQFRSKPINAPDIKVVIANESVGTMQAGYDEAVDVAVRGVLKVLRH